MLIEFPRMWHLLDFLHVDCQLTQPDNLDTNQKRYLMVVPTIFLALARVFVKNENPRGRSTSLTTAGKMSRIATTPRRWRLDHSMTRSELPSPPSSEDPVCNYNTVGDFVPGRYSNAKNNLKARECESFRIGHAMFFPPQMAHQQECQAN